MMILYVPVFQVGVGWLMEFWEKGMVTVAVGSINWQSR